MPRPELTIEPTTELAPELEAKFRQELAIYEGLQEELNEAQSTLDAMKTYLEEMRARQGGNIHLEGGYHVTRVDGGVSVKQNTVAVRKALGITEKAFRATYYTSKPKKAHTLITTPKDKKHDRPTGDVPRDERDTDDHDDE